MASELQRLAEGVRAVGDAAGPMRRELAEGAKRARSLAQSVPRDGGQSGSAVAAALAEAERRCRAADDALARFDAKADAFAKNLAGGPGGGASTVQAVKRIVLAGLSISVVSFANGPLAPAAINSLPVDPGLKESAMTTIAAGAKAVEAGAEAQKKREEMVGEPVAKPLYSDARPPPPPACPRLWKPPK